MESWSALDYIALFFKQDGSFGISLLIIFVSLILGFGYAKFFENKWLAIFGSLLTPVAMISAVSFAYTNYSWIGWTLGVFMALFVAVAFFRAIAAAPEQGSKGAPSGVEEKKIACPHCNSTDIQFMGNEKKSFSVGKAVGGTLLVGGIGAIAGFAGKKGKENDWHCKNCGNTFKK